MRLLLLILLMTLGLIANDKIALVIANKNYTNQTGLNNPINDAKLLKQTLDRMGFEVISIYNKSKSELSRELDIFANKARNAKIAVVYYAGHGVGVNGVNYLVPIGASRLSVYNLGSKLMNLEELKGAVSEAKGFGVVFFDACRNSFFNEKIEGVALSKDGASRALVQPTVRRDQNILVSFSTKAGKIAKDDVNNGDHSPYAIALSEKLPLNKDIRLVMGGVKDRVRDLTQYQQQPVNEDSLGEKRFCLSGCGSTPTIVPIETSKWIVPTNSTCKVNRGDIHKGICYATWKDATRICGITNSKLATRDNFHKTIRDCGGIPNIGLSGLLGIKGSSNLNNSHYQDCYKQKGFSGDKFYWTSEEDSTASQIPDSTTYSWRVGFKYGNEGVSDISKKGYILCVQ